MHSFILPVCACINEFCLNLHGWVDAETMNFNIHLRENMFHIWEPFVWLCKLWGLVWCTTVVAYMLMHTAISPADTVEQGFWLCHSLVYLCKGQEIPIGYYALYMFALTERYCGENVKEFNHFYFLYKGRVFLLHCQTSFHSVFCLISVSSLSFWGNTWKMPVDGSAVEIQVHSACKTLQNYTQGAAETHRRRLGGESK